MTSSGWMCHNPGTLLAESHHLWFSPRTPRWPEGPWPRILATFKFERFAALPANTANTAITAMFKQSCRKSWPSPNIPVGHWHSWRPRKSVHVPLCWQGLDSHSSISVSQCSPENRVFTKLHLTFPPCLYFLRDITCTIYWYLQGSRVNQVSTL